MKAYRRIAVGLAVAAVGYAARFSLFELGDPFAWSLLAIGAGLGIAAAGLLAMRYAAGPRLLALGFVLAASAALLAIPLGFAGDWASAGDALVALGVLLGAASSARLVTAPLERPASRVAGIRRGAYVAAAGSTIFLLADLTLDPLSAAADLPTVVGFMMSGFAAGALQAGLLKPKPPRARAA